MKYYLIVERPENWAADERTGFQQFGLPESKRRMGAEMKTGDVLVTYISGGISAISDCREVTEDGVARNKTHVNYDDIFPLIVKTRPIVVLPKPKWISFGFLTAKLTLTKMHRDWRQVLRTSIRPLDLADGHLLVEALREEQKLVN